MKYSLKQIVDSRSAHKKYIDKIDIWVYFVVRPISNLLTWLFLKLQITANIATLIATIVGIVGTIILMIPGHTLAGLLLLNTWIIFDCIDGNIARTTQSSSKIGEFFDGISGYTFLAFLYTGIGINVYNNYTLKIGTSDLTWIYILLGSLTSMACILPRLIDNKAKNMFQKYRSDISNKDKYTFTYILALNISGVAGISNPLMILAYLTGTLNLYLVIYFFIQSTIGILAIYKTLTNIYRLPGEIS